MSPSEKPHADNRRVLKPYSKAMLKLLSSQKYNAGKRPSEHHIGATSFLRNNSGAIPSNVLTLSNTTASDDYLRYCRENGFSPHPARMPTGLPDFFIRFLTKPRGLVLDPFAGSNTTGATAERLRRRWISIEADPRERPPECAGQLAGDRVRAARRAEQGLRLRLPLRLPTGPTSSAGARARARGRGRAPPRAAPSARRRAWCRA